MKIGGVNVDGWIIAPVVGIIAVAIINGVRTGADTNTWDATSILVASFLGVIVMIKVIMNIFGS